MNKKFNFDYYKETDYFCRFNCNPSYKEGKRFLKPDCVIRAFALAAGLTWLEAFDLLVAHARNTYTVPNGKDNYDFVFKHFGFERKSITVGLGCKRITVEDFCKLHPKGRFIVKVAHHLTPVVDGVIYDNFNPSRKCVYCYYQLNK